MAHVGHTAFFWVPTGDARNVSSLKSNCTLLLSGFYWRCYLCPLSKKSLDIVSLSLSGFLSIWDTRKLLNLKSHCHKAGSFLTYKMLVTVTIMPICKFVEPLSLALNEIVSSVFCIQRGIWQRKNINSSSANRKLTVRNWPIRKRKNWPHWFRE